MNRLQPGTLRRVEVMLAVVLTAGLLGLHVVVLTHAGPLWRDEISSLTLATKPSWQELWSTLLVDPFPILFFALLRFWHGLFGDWDFGLRLLGYGTGAAAIAALWVGARLTGRRTPLVSFALLGFAPLLIVWGDSLRGYGLGVLWIAIVFGAFWKLIEETNAKTFSLAAAAAILSVQSVFTNALLVFSCGLAAIVVAASRRSWRTVLAVIGAGTLAALSLLPYVPTVLAAQEWSQVRKLNFPFRHHLGVLATALSSPAPFFLWIWIVVAAGALAVGIAIQWPGSWRWLRREDRRVMSYAIIASTVGGILTVAFFRLVCWPTNVWYYLPVLTVAALAINIVLDLAAGDATGRLVKIVAVAICLAAAFPTIWERLQMRASNVDLIAQTIETNEQAGDIVIIDPFVDAITFKRYYRGKNEYMSVPPLRDLTLHRWDEVLAQMRTGEAMPPVLQKIRETLQAGHRVWLISETNLVAVKKEPPAVKPLDPSAARPLGYFLFAWSRQLMYELQTRSTGVAAVAPRSVQPISPYEKDLLFLISGWRETAAAESP